MGASSLARGARGRKEKILDTHFTARSRHWRSACTVGIQCDGDIGKRNYFLMLTYPLAILFLYTTLFLRQASISHTQDYRNQRECLPVNNVRSNTNLIKMCVKKSTSTTQHWMDDVMNTGTTPNRVRLVAW
jgi:hypothetical protein